MICIHCKEEILPHEILPVAEGKMHRECLMRSIIGCVAHQQRMHLRCDLACRDDENLTTREAARAAWSYFCELQDKAVMAKYN